MFVNFSNHPSTKWSESQMKAALAYGPVTDLHFPSVSPMATKQEIAALAADYVAQILQMNPTCVLCQGEFCLVYETVRLLKEHGCLVVAACSERNVKDLVTEDGSQGKAVFFDFVQFREY